MVGFCKCDESEGVYYEHHYKLGKKHCKPGVFGLIRHPLKTVKLYSLQLVFKRNLELNNNNNNTNNTTTTTNNNNNNNNNNTTTNNNNN